METKTAHAPAEVSNPERTGLRVECAPDPDVQGGTSDLVVEVQVMLDPNMLQEVHWKTGRSMEGRPVMMVESVAKESEAFRRGMRPNMVVKSMTSRSGRTQQEEWRMSRNSAINVRNNAIHVQKFQDVVRHARYPILFEMLGGVKLVSEDRMKNLISRKGERLGVTRWEGKRFPTAALPRDFPTVIGSFPPTVAFPEDYPTVIGYSPSDRRDPTVALPEDYPTVIGSSPSDRRFPNVALPEDYPTVIGASPSDFGA
jgi:hypothetical protein